MHSEPKPVDFSTKVIKSILEDEVLENLFTSVDILSDGKRDKKKVKKICRDLQDHLYSAVAHAIPLSLYLKSLNGVSNDGNWSVEVIIYPFVYTLDARKSGESITIHPSFQIVSDSIDIGDIVMDIAETKLSDQIDVISGVAEYVTDSVYLWTLMKLLMNFEFDKNKNTWIENDPVYPQIDFTEEFSQIITASYICEILHALGQGPSSELDNGDVHIITYEGEYVCKYKENVPSEIFFIPDMSFKLTCKNDRIELVDHDKNENICSEELDNKDNDLPF